jgi:hypothetical protein
VNYTNARGVFSAKAFGQKNLNRLKSIQKEQIVKYKKLLTSRDKKSRKALFS